MLIFLGLFIANPVVEAPIIRLSGGGAPPIFPFLFVTIACGAISGFHGLVASGTTSKQISSIDHARFIGYGGMLGEGSLALASTLAAVAGMGLITVCNLPSVGMVENLSWAVYYDSWAHATTNKATAFVLGGGALIEAIGVPGPLNDSIGYLLCSYHTGYSHKDSKVYYCGNWDNDIHKTFTKSLYCNNFSIVSVLDFDDVECTKYKYRRIYPGRMGFVAYFWCKQSDAGCFDTYDFKPLFFSQKKTGSSIGITFFVYYCYYIDCLDFKNSGILGN